MTAATASKLGLWPELTDLQTVTPDLVYAPNLNSIVSVSTGTVSWMSGDSPTYFGFQSESGALAGSRVVFLSGARVLAQSY